MRVKHGNANIRFHCRVKLVTSTVFLIEPGWESVTHLPSEFTN